MQCKNRLFRVVLILILICLSQEALLYPNGTLNVSFAQFNDTELQWVKNDSIFYGFDYYFSSVVTTHI